MSLQVIGCGCTDALQNTGIPAGGGKKFGTAVGVFIQETLKADGTFNSLDLTTSILPQILAGLNHVDPKQRLFFVGDLDNIEPANEGAQFDTAANGKRFKVRDGIESMTIGFKTNASHQLFSKIAEICGDVSIYPVDTCGNLLVVKDGTTGRGRRIATGSYNSQLDMAGSSTVQSIMANFDWYSRKEQLNQWLISDKEIGADLTETKSMIDVYVDAISASTSALIFEAEYGYGTAITQIPVVGLLLANVTIFNVTTGLAVTVTGVTYNTVNKQYTAAYSTGVTAADVLRVTVYKAATTVNVNPLLGLDTVTAA